MVPKGDRCGANVARGGTGVSDRFLLRIAFAGKPSLLLERDMAEEMLQYAVERLPYEAGGLIAGHRAGDGTQCASRFIALESAFLSETRYTARASLAVRAVFATEQRGECVIATVHSHPQGDGLPSERDIREAFGYTDLLHIIIHFAQGKAQLRFFSYQTSENGFSYLEGHPSFDDFMFDTPL